MPLRFNQRFGALGAAAAAPPAGSASPPGMQENPTGSFAFLDPKYDGADYFFYVTNPGTLDHGDSATSNIQIDAGTDFLWLATTYQADIAGAAITLNTLPVPNVTMTIQDTGATKNLMNGPVPLNCIAGIGEFPYRLPRPRLFRATSVINFAWTSYEAADNYADIYFVMHGIRAVQGTFDTPAS